MISLLEAFTVALKELLLAGRNLHLQEDALKRAEEKLAKMRKRVRYGEPGKG